MTGAADDELLRRHVAGDDDAFAELVRRHRERLWAVALRTLGNRDDAADALQDAFVSAYRRAGTFRGDAQVSTWLHRIVVNACLDRMRRSAARPTAVLPEQGPGEPADPHDRIADSDLSHDVAAALAGLASDQRAAVVLVDVQGYSVAEAARILEVPEGTVKSRCARGRARLAVSLGYLRNPDAPAGVQPPTAGAEPREGT